MHGASFSFSLLGAALAKEIRLFNISFLGHAISMDMEFHYLTIGI